MARIFDRLSEEFSAPNRPATQSATIIRPTTSAFATIPADSISATPGANDRLPSVLVPGIAGVNYRTAAGRRSRALHGGSATGLYEVSYDRTREMELLARYRHLHGFRAGPSPGGVWPSPAS